VKGSQRIPTGPLVLVVDDYADNRELMCEVLAHEGFRVIEAKTGLEAVDRAVELRPAVVLMDLALPGIDGWEATRRLRADERTAGCRVIAVTAHAHANAADRAREVGCRETITKPFAPDELVATVRRVLVEPAAEKAPAAQDEAPRPTTKGRKRAEKTEGAGATPPKTRARRPGDRPAGRG
jgi:two-component system, cell cycle response regulator DivK